MTEKTDADSLGAALLDRDNRFDCAIAALRAAEEIPDELLAHTVAAREHVNLTGVYVWASTDQATENPDGFRPLRPLPEVALLAA
jgi:hypothetical protein